MWARLSEYRSRSRYMNALYFVCVFFVCDVIITLTYDPNRMTPRNLVVDILVAVIVSLLDFVFYKVMKSLRKTDQQKQA